MSPSPPGIPTEDTVLFRPSKKRKIYRQRATTDDDAVETEAPQVATPAMTKPAMQSIDELIASASVISEEGGSSAEVDSVSVSMAEILRLRKKNKRVGGVEFRASAQGQRDDDRSGVVNARTVDVEIGEEGGLDVSNGGPRKFAPQTGAVGDVNKHMMAYVDSEIAKRRSEGVMPTNTVSAIHASQPSSSTTAQQIASSKDTSIKTDPTLTRQPATIGKLQEIDLGDEARSINVQRTAKAQRVLNGEMLEDEGMKKVGNGKVRLGPDGKPWRGRKRRGSDDVKRDQLVEDILRENRLEIYPQLPPNLPTTDPNAPNSLNDDDDTPADDRIAEAFRREFMDALSSQRQRKKVAQVSAAGGGRGSGAKDEEVLKGPKLGGSRNSRAAVRDALLKQAGTGRK